MDNERIEHIGREDSSEETINLTTRLVELTKPGEYRTSNGVWYGTNTPEMALNQRRTRMMRDRMEEQKREPEEGTLRREELNRVTEKIRNMPKQQQGEQPGTCGGTQKVLETIETE